MPRSERGPEILKTLLKFAFAVAAACLWLSTDRAAKSPMWTATTPLPKALETLAVAVSGGYLYVIGGNSNNQPSSSVYYAATHSDGTLSTFQQTTSLPYTLYRYICGVANNGFLYAVGGIANGQATSGVMYAPINGDGSIGQWSSTTPLPTPLQLQGTVAEGGFLYVLGGSTNPLPQPGGETSAVLYAKFNSDGTLGPFTATADLPTATYKTCPVASDGNLFLVGGETPHATDLTWYATPNPDGSISSWTPSIPLLYTDAATAVVASGRDIFIMGGDTTGGGPDTFLVSVATIEADGLIGSWRYAPSLPRTVSRNAGATIDNHVYSLGGLRGLSDTSQVLLMTY